MLIPCRRVLLLLLLLVLLGPQIYQQVCVALGGKQDGGALRPAGTASVVYIVSCEGCSGDCSAVAFLELS